ncbi:hypothetical protein Nepgr_012672 [Nepenthes gracilis]|uniref:Phospholipase/carboxylesterase/thioesterase domain-containing protein n=1 Tax=Nepenthes gracilis TaxID=150966 RepID=A0AAD3XNK5_NEPGR|nr:hypothetical protein Nepgr_012672 [Nepenthes gracilis]
MSFGSDIGGAGSTAATTFEYGWTYVVRPKGKHQATIVWLHGLGDKGSSWSQLFETLPLPNIKWICPTAPTRPVEALGGFSCTAWFEVGELSEDAADDLEGLNASAAHVANLLSTEPPDVKLGVGGFSMGAAMALYSATCQNLGRYGNGNPYPIKLSAIVGLSGWLPCSRSLSTWMEESQEPELHAASLPILLCHGSDCQLNPNVVSCRFSSCSSKPAYRCVLLLRMICLPLLNPVFDINSMFSADEIVAYEHGEKSAQTLASIGFQNLTFRTYDGLGHYTIPEETDELCNWLTATLELEGNSSG